MVKIKKKVNKMYMELPLLKFHETVTSGNEIDVRHLEFTNNLQYALHWHDYYTIDMITHGSGVHWLNQKEYPLKRGNIQFILPSDIHSIISSDSIGFLSLRFTDAAIPQQFRFLFNSSQQIFMLSQQELKLVTGYASAIAYYNQNSNSILKQAVEHCFYLILFHIAQFVQKDLPAPCGADAMHNAMHYLDTHFCESPSQEKVAAFVGLTPAYFSSCFHKYVGSTYTCYLTKKKIVYACSLMPIKNLSITDICYASGFQSISNFNHAFKKGTGHSPSEYRKLPALGGLSIIRQK